LPRHSKNESVRLWRLRGGQPLLRDDAPQIGCPLSGAAKASLGSWLIAAVLPYGGAVAVALAEFQIVECPSHHSNSSSARASSVVRTLRPMPLLSGRLILEDQAEQDVAAVGSAFRRLGSIGSPHLAQVPYVPSDIRFSAASI